MNQQEIEAKNQRVRSLLWVSMVAFCAFQLPLLGKELTLGDELSRVPWLSYFNLLGAVGGLLWGYLMVRVGSLQRAINRDPAARAALNDERIQHARLRAFRAGFFALIAYLVLLRLSTIVVSVPLGFAVQLGIFMAVLVTTAAFLFFEHSEA
jgi:hypothetical protein